MKSINIKVDYYDNEQKELFKKHCQSEKIQDIAGKVIEVSEAEFWTYMIFTEKGKNKMTFQSYNDINKKLANRIGMFKEYLGVNDENVYFKFDSNQEYKDITERIGVAGSLCLINFIHDLTEADWEMIPEEREKNLDFKISDGEKFIYVESKGSILKDNQKKASTTSQHKKSIEGKKRVQRDQKENKTDIFYGVITVADNNPDNTLQSWLVDPDVPSSIISPLKYRLLSRLYFYWTSLKLIFQRTSIQLALINRIKIIEISDNYEIFNGLPLLNANGEKIEIYHGSFSSKSIIEEDGIIGRLVFLERDKLMFIGFEKNLFDILISQDFHKVTKYAFYSEVKKAVITCRIKMSEAINSNILENIINKCKIINKNIVEFKIENKFYYSRSGRVFGIIDLSNKNQFF